MIETKSIVSWTDFHDALREFRKANSSSSGGQEPRFLFRGHQDSTWQLESTLYRLKGGASGFLDYYATVNRTVDAIASITGKSWDVVDTPLVRKMVTRPPGPHSLPSYEYIVYLRHRGFPSPLLDWTTSPYVAAFFAYQEAGTESDMVAIYGYVDRHFGSRSGSDPYILNRGPFVTTDPRHFAQKCWYTTALQWDEETETLMFASHQAVFDRGPIGHDTVVKFEIPASERLAALTELNDFNIDAFTLFQDEDALVSSLALREFELDLI